MMVNPACYSELIKFFQSLQSRRLQNKSSNLYLKLYHWGELLSLTQQKICFYEKALINNLLSSTGTPCFFFSVAQDAVLMADDQWMLVDDIISHFHGDMIPAMKGIDKSSWFDQLSKNWFCSVLVSSIFLVNQGSIYASKLPLRLVTINLIIKTPIIRST